MLPPARPVLVRIASPAVSPPPPATKRLTSTSGRPVDPAADGPTPRAPAVRLKGVALGIALALPLAVYASPGAFARYVADDYCWAGLLRTQGFVDAQVAWYTSYSPRYAFTFLVNLVELAGPPIVPLLPAVAIVTAVATTG